MVCASGIQVLLCGVLYKVKQKHQQRKTNVAEPVVSNQHLEGSKSKDVSAATLFRLTENRKRKTSSDVQHDGIVPEKRLKFSSLFTNNPEIPRVDR